MLAGHITWSPARANADGQLYEALFTALASGGPEDLFPETEVDAIITVLREIRSTAIPVAEAV